MLRRSTDYLTARHCDTPRLDAELLLADVLRVERLVLYTDHDRPLTADETDRYRDAIARRGRREPVAYILGRRGFRRRDLAVSPAVLVPRPETELLVDWVVEVAPDGGSVLDWGTGSGAIALALSDERPDLVLTAIDISEDALAIARVNDPSERVEWVRSDGFTGVAGRVFDVIVANPPYLSDAELGAAPPELGFEPAAALSAGPTGYEAIDRIVHDAPAHLADGGWLLLEVGQGQAAEVSARLAVAGYGAPATRPDLAGIDRMVGGRRP